MQQTKKLNSINDQNKRQLQQKYLKYKANKLQITKQQQLSTAILSQVHSNTIINIDKNESKLQRQINPQNIQNVDMDSNNFNRLLKIMPKNQIILQVMLRDPCVNQLSQQLKKQSQQKNMQTLISSFPQRYQNLLQIQIKYKNLQKTSKQKYQTFTKQIQLLMQKLLKMQQQNKQLNKIIDNQNNMIKFNQIEKYNQLSQEIKRRELCIIELRDQVDKVNKKCNKYKEDYKNSHAIILQLREQQENGNKQTQRLVEKLKENQQKLTKCHKKLLEFNNEKKLEINSLTQQYEDKIKEIQEQKMHVEQLLGQANMRVQYKQSLLIMSQKQSQETINKLEQENAKRYSQLQQLRQQHLNALRTIDELQQRINQQQEQIVRQSQMWTLQKQQLKKQLQKSHQCSASLKTQLDYKSQLIKTLQKSIQHLKSSFQLNLLKKTNQWLQQNKQLLQSKQQMCKLKQQFNRNTQQYQKTLKNYLQKIVEQEQVSCQLQFKIQNWMSNKRITANIRKNYFQNDLQGNEKQFFAYPQRKKSTNQQQQTNLTLKTDIKIENDKKQKYNKKLSQYQLLIQRLKKQMISLTNTNRQNLQKFNKIMKDLINENRILKKQIQLLKQPFANQINLFSLNIGQYDKGDNNI